MSVTGTVSSVAWQFSRFAGAAVILAAVLVLLGWGLGIPLLTSAAPGWPRMVPATALAFVLSGLAVLCAAWTRVRVGLAGAVIAIGVLRALELAWGADWGVFELTVQEASGPARAATSPATAASFVLAGLALVLVRSPRRGERSLGQALALVTLLIACLSLGRFLYGGEPLLSIGQMSAPTSGLFFVLSLAVLALRSEEGLVALVGSNTQGGAIARRLLPPALAVPFLVGWLRLQGERAGWYGTEAGILLFALSNVVLFGALVWVNAAFLHRSDLSRRLAERRTEAQLARLDLLHQITRAISERHDLRSIFQVVIRTLEEQLPVDFTCICLIDPGASTLRVSCTGAGSQALAGELALVEGAELPINENGLSRCLGGQLVYEPDLSRVGFPFPKKLASGGLGALVAAPLLVESQVFGALLAARREANSFSSGECEFLRQLSEHVALAAHQAQLHGALQQAYDDLRSTQQVVLQQERLRALGQMASGIAHDINNALSPVSLYTESLLESERHLSQRGREQLEIIQRAIDDVAETVARMRESSRAQSPESAFGSLNLNQLVEQVVSLTRARWSDMAQEKGTVVTVRTQLATDLPPARGSESEIREALINLVLNAVDAMPAGGTLTLRTASVPSPLGPGGAGPPQASIEVSDTGVGMDEATRQRCLEPFFTTKGERGTGLGLAMVYGAAKRHGAELEVESAVGQGTTVRFVFPVPAQMALLTARADPASGPVKRLRILIIDDDPLLRRSLGDSLEGDGHLVTAADGGRAGIDAFHEALQRREPFDAVITDLGMPHVDGRTVARAVKTASSATAVLLLTGWGRRLKEEANLPDHVDRVLSKPPKLHELRQALSDCCSLGGA